MMDQSKPKPQPDILDGASDSRSDPIFDNHIGYIPFSYHLLPLRGIAKAAAVMRGGERIGRGPRDWDLIPIPELLNHVISHVIAYLSGRRDDTHLANAACRLLMALELDREEDLPRPAFNPEKVDQKPVWIEEEPDPTPEIGPGWRPFTPRG